MTEVTENEELIKFAEKLADFVHDKKIEAVILPGSSARTAWIFLSAALKQRYPSKPLPKVYSMGQSIHYFVGRPDMSWEIHLLNKPYYDERINEFKDFLKRTRPNIFGQSKKPVLVLDEETFSGRTLSNVKYLFKKMGFKQIFIGTINQISPHDSSKIGLDIFGLGRLNVYGKRRDILEAHKNKNKSKRDDLRRELREQHNKIRNLLKNVRPRRF